MRTIWMLRILREEDNHLPCPRIDREPKFWAERQGEKELGMGYFLE